MLQHKQYLVLLIQVLFYASIFLMCLLGCQKPSSKPLWCQRGQGSTRYDMCLRPSLHPPCEAATFNVVTRSYDDYKSGRSSPNKKGFSLYEKRNDKRVAAGVRSVGQLERLASLHENGDAIPRKGCRPIGGLGTLYYLVFLHWQAKPEKWFYSRGGFRLSSTFQNAKQGFLL